MRLVRIIATHLAEHDPSYLLHLIEKSCSLSVFFLRAYTHMFGMLICGDILISSF